MIPDRGLSCQCRALQDILPDNTFLANATVYNTAAHDFWCKLDYFILFFFFKKKGIL
jgi:hypothetical protein